MNKQEYLKNRISQGTGPLQFVCKVRAKPKVTGDYILDCDDLEILEFRFQEWSIFLLAAGEDDTVKFLTEIPPTWSEYTQTDLTSSIPWVSAIGCDLFNFWLMENHKGYTDAVQFEFGKPGYNLKHRIQLEVSASMFAVYSVKIEKGNLMRED